MLNGLLKGLVFVLKWVERRGENKGGFKRLWFSFKLLWLLILTTLILGINTVSIQKFRHESRSRFELILNL